MSEKRITLKQLQDMLEKVNTMGFEPEEVEVQFQYTLTELSVSSAISSVRADKDVKPILKIDLR